MPHIHVFQHVQYEEVGSIDKWAHNKNHHLTFTRFYEHEELPSLDTFEWLIVMGGPMNTNEDAKYPWLLSEKKFIESAIRSGKKILGICLGAQLIADVLGAKVSRCENKEIGWFNIQMTDRAKEVFLFEHFPHDLKVFQWHGNTFELPDGAILIATNEICKNQAFIYGGNIVGLQFHMETTRSLMEIWLKRNEFEVASGNFVQTTQFIKKHIEYFPIMNQMFFEFLNRFEKI